MMLGRSLAVASLRKTISLTTNMTWSSSRVELCPETEKLCVGGTHLIPDISFVSLCCEDQINSLNVRLVPPSVIV